MAVPVIFVMVALLVSFMLPPKYEATATLTSTDPSGMVGYDALLSTVIPIANEVALEESENVEIDVAAPVTNASVAAARAISITASGRNADECIAAANETAQIVKEKASDVFQQLSDEFEDDQTKKRDLVIEALGASVDPTTRALLESIMRDNHYAHCTFTVTDATKAETSGLSVAEIILVAGFMGLFVSICMVLLIDAKKMPIKSNSEVSSRFDYPVLSYPGVGHEGDRIWTGIRFTLDRDPSSIAIVPVGRGEASCVACLLSSTMSDAGSIALAVDNVTSCNTSERNGLDNVQIIECLPLSDGVEAAYAAKKVDATIICARLWKDSMRDLARTCEELVFAGGEIIGIVLLSSDNR